MDRARAETDAALVLDGGDLFLPLRTRTATASRPTRARSSGARRLLDAAYGRMGTTALVPGERDLALGLPLLRKLAKQAGIPLLAANLYGRDGKRLFDADRIVDAAGIKVGMFGVTAPPTPDDAAAFKAAGIDARDPTAAAREAVAGLRARGAKIVVALVHVGDGNDTRKLVAAVPGIDWAVLGHTGMNLQMPEKAGGARMLEAMIQGKHVGRLDLHVVGDKLAFTDRGERAEIETILADHRRQLDRIPDRHLGDDRSGHDARLLRAASQGDRDGDRAGERAPATIPAAINGELVREPDHPLDATTPDQLGVRMLVDVYKRESVRRAAAGKPVGLEGGRRARATPRPAAAAGTATSGRRVRRCHAPALAFGTRPSTPARSRR